MAALDELEEAIHALGRERAVDVHARVAGSGGPNSRTCHLFVALSPKGAELGGAAHEATLGHFEDVGVFEAVARNFEASGYPDLGELQAKLVEGGNDAAAEYPKLDRILSAEVVE